MPRKQITSLDETSSMRSLRAQIRAREEELGHAVAQAEGLKLELLVVQREYALCVEPLLLEVELLDEQIFALKKVRDLMDKGETLENAKRIVKERDRLRDERERSRLDEESGKVKREKRNDDNFAKDESKGAMTPELKKLWRELAYRFHPDLTQDTQEKSAREVMMKQLNDSYMRRDIGAMHELATMGSCGTEKRAADERDLQESLLDLDEALRRVTQRLLAFRRSPWHGIRAEIRKAKRSHRDYFAELAAAQELEIAAREKLIARIEGELEAIRKSVLA